LGRSDIVTNYFPLRAEKIKLYAKG